MYVCLSTIVAILEQASFIAKISPWTLLLSLLTPLASLVGIEDIPLWYITAPAPVGPGFPRALPSVKATMFEMSFKFSSCLLIVERHLCF